MLQDWNMTTPQEKGDDLRSGQENGGSDGDTQ